jgi:hypothetical protein
VADRRFDPLRMLSAKIRGRRPGDVGD